MSEITAMERRLRQWCVEFREMAEWGERIADEMAANRSNPDGGLVGATEAAEILGLQRNSVSRLLARGQAPDPVATLAMGPVWNRADIEAWARRRSRG